MQFKDLDDNGYRQVCEFIAERATGVTTDKGKRGDYAKRGKAIFHVWYAAPGYH